MYGEAWETELPASKFDDRLLKELFWLALVLMKILLPGVLWLLGISLLFLSKCSVYVGKSSRSQQNKSGKLIQIAKEREAPMCCFLESFWHWTGDSSIWDFLCVTHMKPKGSKLRAQNTHKRLGRLKSILCSSEGFTTFLLSCRWI